MLAPEPSVSCLTHRYRFHRCRLRDISARVSAQSAPVGSISSDPRPQEMVESWVIGVLLSTVAGIVNAIGVIMQKLAHTANDALPVEERRSYLCNPMWLLGFAVYVVGNIANAFALAYAPQSVITPLNRLVLSDCLSINALHHGFCPLNKNNPIYFCA
jgi:hypothetical protein